MTPLELFKLTRAAKIIQYEWRYYKFFDYDVCEDCGYGGRILGCGCSYQSYDKIYNETFDIQAEV